MNSKKLFLLDSMALVYRAYFAFANNHRYNPAGLNTSTMLGFTNTLLEVLQKEKPTHIAVVTDTAAPTQRHVDFTSYKAHRDEVPDDIIKALPYIRKIVESMNIPFISMDGYEADDIIGTLAIQAEAEGFQVFMMTPDKDFGQLVSENIFMYKPARMGNGAEIMGPAEICKRFEIDSPKQVIDILGLMGDTADNIPGIKGVGEKTAITLIKQFGSVENLLENTALLKGKLKENVERDRDMAILSKKLATIILNVPVTFNEELFILQSVNKEEVKTLFEELDFKTLLRRVLYEEPAVVAKPTVVKEVNVNQSSLFDEPSAAAASNDIPQLQLFNFENINTIKHDYKLIEFNDVDEFVKLLNLQQEVCFDTETTGVDAMTAELVGMSFSFESKTGFYISVPADRESVLNILEKFKPFFENKNIKKIGQNIKYDLHILRNYNIRVEGVYFDTMLAHYLLEPDQRHGMDFLSEHYLNYAPVSIETLIGKKGKTQLSMRDVPLDVIKDYAAEDADITLQLKKIFDKQLEETKTNKVFEEIEMPLVSVLVDMEIEGAAIDKGTLKEISKQLEIDLTVVEKEITDMAGTQFNLNSPKQLGEILFDVLKIDEKAKKTKTGQYATGEEILVKLSHKHPIIEKILEYREFQKLKSTYVDTLPLLVNENTNKIHTSYNQAVAATGRLSSNNPNLQNIPIRTARGREIRKAFIPRNSEFVLLSSDYSQIELRIIAALSKEEGMIEAFKNGEDIHSSTAAKVWGVDLSEVTKEMRSKAKTVNFGIIYGISAFGLSERINIPRGEAKELIDNYFLKYPGIKKYMDDTVNFARENGFVETIMGRRRYIKDINVANAVSRGFAERNAINAPIQGSAADMIKIAMIKIDKEIKSRNLKSKMILQVHDELIFDCHISEKDELSTLVKDLMKNAIDLPVPIDVEFGFGNNWLEAH